MAITSDKLLNRPSELHRRYGGRLAMKEAQQKRMIGGGPSNVVLTKKSIKDIVSIKVNVIKIENILKGTLTSEKKSLDEKKRRESGKRREKQEEKLETKPQAEKGPIKMPKIPRMGFLDWIKNFIGNVILGYFAIRLLDYLPKIKPIIKFLGSAADFVIDFGGKLLDGLVTFVDWGYKAIDFTRGMMKSIGGENFAKVFDGFTGAVGTLVETAIIAATVLATQGDGGVLDIGMDMLKDRLLGQGAQRAAQAGAQAAGQAGGTAAQAGGIGAGAVAGIVAGAGLLASALGEGAFQVRKVVVKPIQNLEKAYKEDKNPLTKIGRGIALNMVRPLYGLFSTVGFLLDVVGAPFRYAIELLRFPFLSEEDKQKQANNLAKFDARIREDLRKALNMVTLGLAFKEKGSFGNIYGNKGAQKEMMGKMAGGGITRGGRRQTGARRTISKGTKGKYKRVVPRKPGEVEIKPGADIGGEDKIFGIFPNPLKAAQRALDVVNPFKVVKTAGEDLGKTDYFGPILAITSKITLGQKPSQKDYENVGLGINMLIAKGIRDKQLKGGVIAAFAEGGLVDPDVLSAAETGGDISNWVAKTFQSEIESNAQKTLRLIKENSQKKEETEKETQKGSGEGLEDDGFEVGPAGSSGDKLTMARNLMRDLKLTPAQAAGIVGNMAAESGVENARPQGSRPGVKAPLKVDGVTGYGLVQWTSKGRQQALADFAKSRGADLSKPLSMNIEYQFFLKEFQGSYGKVLSQIRQAQDVKTASTIFMQQYEIPAGYKTNAKIMERYNMSKPIYDQLAVGKGKATEGAGTYIGPVGQVGDERLTGANPKAKQIIEGAKKIIGMGAGVRDQCANTTRSALKAAGHPAANKRTQKGDLDTPKGTAYNAPSFAASFGGSDLGQVIRNKQNIRAGDIILWRDYAGGRYGKGAITHVGIAADDGLKNQYDHNRARGWHYRPHWDRASGTEWFAGVRLMDAGGMINGLTPAILGERGKPEGVIGSKVTEYLEEMAPGTLPAIIGASSKQELANTLRTLNDYGFGPPEEVFVVSSDIDDNMSDYEDSGSSGLSMVFAGAGSDPFESLYQGW